MHRQLLDRISILHQQLTSSSDVKTSWNEETFGPRAPTGNPTTSDKDKLFRILAARYETRLFLKPPEEPPNHRVYAENQLDSSHRKFKYFVTFRFFSSFVVLLRHVIRSKLSRDFSGLLQYATNQGCSTYSQVKV